MSDFAHRMMLTQTEDMNDYETYMAEQAYQDEQAEKAYLELEKSSQKNIKKQKMALDLTVLPNRYYKIPESGGDCNGLTFDKDHKLFERIQSLPSWELKPDQDFIYYHGRGIDDSKTDDYNDPLRYVEAGSFADIYSDSYWNRAVLTFLRSLPPKMPIVLYWH